MGLMHEARREFIAAPDNKKGQIVFKWPDENIRKFSRAIVEPDAVAVFMSQGQVMGVLPPGQHTLDAQELPFLGLFIDWATGGNAFKAEIYFVGNREFPNNRFGGRLDEVQDPLTGLIVTLRAFGEYSLRVADPTKLILNLVGTVDVTNNDAITGWVAEQLLKVTRTTVTIQLVSGAWPILGLSAHSPDIESAAMPAANGQLADYGIIISRLGNLDVNLDEDDNARLKKLAGDAAYSRLAGGFLQAAQAEALQGAGEGMAQGGAAVTPMFLGAGFGMANQMMQAPGQAPPYPPPAPGQYAPAPPPPPGAPPAGAPPAAAAPTAAAAPAAAAPTAVPPPNVVETVAAAAPAGAAPAAAAPAGAAPSPAVACPSCQAQVREGARFCDSCGSPMQVQCASCQAALRPGAKFCDSCGTPTKPQPAAG